MNKTRASRWRCWGAERISSLLLIVFSHLAVLTTPSMAQDFDVGVDNPQITGGTLAAPRAWNFTVSLRAVDVSARRLQYFCGGALVTPQWVVTAAHCVEDWTSERGLFRNRRGVVEVVTASADLAHVDRKDVFQIYAVYKHPSYGGREGHRDDIALIRLASAAGEGIPVAHERLPIEREAEVAGFGRTGEDRLSDHITLGSGFLASAGSFELLRVKVEPSTGCQAAYPEFDSNTQLCFGSAGKDSCQGDSGGPLVVRYPELILIGVVSYGRGCGRRDAPGVYTAVDAYVAWMNTVISNK